MKVIEQNGYWIIKCKPCGQELIPVDKGWKFNGDFEKPTFTPSVNVRCNSPDHPSYNPEAKSSVCHFIITDGKIAYCGDCTHELKGQTFDLESFTEEELLRYRKW